MAKAKFTGTVQETVLNSEELDAFDPNKPGVLCDDKGNVVNQHVLDRSTAKPKGKRGRPPKKAAIMSPLKVDVDDNVEDIDTFQAVFSTSKPNKKIIAYTGSFGRFELRVSDVYLSPIGLLVIKEIDDSYSYVPPISNQSNPLLIEVDGQTYKVAFYGHYFKLPDRNIEVTLFVTLK